MVDPSRKGVPIEENPITLALDVVIPTKVITALAVGLAMSISATSSEQIIPVPPPELSVTVKDGVGFIVIIITCVTGSIHPLASIENS